MSDEHESEVAAITAQLESLRTPLLAELERRGGRGVELANRIDRLTYAIDALNGGLVCPMCEELIAGE